MTVVTLPMFAPPARGDAKPWITAQIEEAAASTGSWTLIDTIVLSPVEVDPALPLPRTLTTEHATLVAGWYRVTLADADGDTVILTPVQPAGDWRPTIADLGKRMRARTLNDNGQLIGTFDSTTTISDQDAQTAIVDAVDVVTGSLDTEIPLDKQSFARFAVIARAAMILERSFYPEDTNADDSAYQTWLGEYNAMMTQLRPAVTAGGRLH